MEIRRFALSLVLCCAVLVPAVAVGGGDTGADAHAEHSLNWFDFSHWIGDNEDPTPPIIALLINFGLALYVIYLILRKPLGRKFKDRRSDLETAIKEASDMKAKAEQAMAEARDKMERIDQEMAKIRSEIIEAGKAESGAIVESAEQWAKRLRSDTEALLEAEVALVAQEIREKMADEIVGTAEKLVQERMNASDQERITGEYLDSIRSKDQAGASQE